MKVKVGECYSRAGIRQGPLRRDKVARSATETAITHPRRFFNLLIGIISS